MTTVHGDLVLRDGQYVSTGDIAFSLQVGGGWGGEGGAEPAALGMGMGMGVSVIQGLTCNVPAPCTLCGEGLAMSAESCCASWLATGLQGVYVAAAGKLTAVVEPVGQPLKLPAASEGGEEEQPEQQRRQRAVEKQQQQGSQKRLRAAARQVALLAAQQQEAGAEPQQLPDPSESFQAARSWQLCELILELSVAQPAAPAPAAAPAAAGAGQAQGARGPLAGGSAGIALGRRGMISGGEQQQQQAGQREGLADLLLNGTLTSRGCGIRLEVNLSTAHLEEYYHKAVKSLLRVPAWQGF